MNQNKIQFYLFKNKKEKNNNNNIGTINMGKYNWKCEVNIQIQYNTMWDEFYLFFFASNHPAQLLIVELNQLQVGEEFGELSQEP